MSTLLCAWKKLLSVAIMGSIPLLIQAQSPFSPQGSEYTIAGFLPGDQVHPQIAIDGSGGYIVWEDNFTDGDGLGISAQRLDQSLSGTLSTFRVNENGAGDQENPKVALLRDGGAVFVWQGGKLGFQQVYARFVASDGTFFTGDVLVNTFAKNQQIDPSVAVLSDGSVVIVWTSYGQDDAGNPDTSLSGLQGVFGQRFSAKGEKLGGEFQVNETILRNQRSPVVTATSNGFLIGWVSEKFSKLLYNKSLPGTPAEIQGGAEQYVVGVFLRPFGLDGTAQGHETLASSGDTVAANPALGVSSDGSIIVSWSQLSSDLFPQNPNINEASGWDVYARTLGPDLTAKGDAFLVNTETRKNQIAPKIATIGLDNMVVWTSDGQDGSQEGVYGKVISSQGVVEGDEFRVNTTTVSQQLFPAIASDGSRSLVALWASYTPGGSGFDLYAQRYGSSEVLIAPAAPYTSAVSQSKLSVTWPDVAGLDVANYLVFIDGSSQPINVNGNLYQLGQLAAGSSHSFKLAYKLNDGRTSPFSASASAKTWGEDSNFDGLPDDWQAQYWGNDPSKWPGPSVDSDSDGATNLQEFLAGTNPVDSASVLKMQISSSNQGVRLNWNAKQGMIYQVQISSNGNVWSDLGKPRFAVGASDSIPIDSGGNLSLYRIIRVR